MEILYHNLTSEETVDMTAGDVQMLYEKSDEESGGLRLLRKIVVDAVCKCQRTSTGVESGDLPNRFWEDVRGRLKEIRDMGNEKAIGDVEGYLLKPDREETPPRKASGNSVAAHDVASERPRRGWVFTWTSAGRFGFQ